MKVHSRSATHRKGAVRGAALFASVCIALTTTTIDTPTVEAAGAPTVGWVTASGQTVAGIVVLRALAEPDPVGSSPITKWCMTKDSTPINTDLSSVNPEFPYTDVSSSSTFSGLTGCWTALDGNLLGGEFAFDTTAWADGTHTYQLIVTDAAGHSASSALLSITTNNPGPQVGWVTSSGQTLSGTITLQALAAPNVSGTASITKWCMTKDGSHLTADHTSFNASYPYGDVSHAGTFNALTGCWSSLYSNLLGGEFVFDTTAWTNGTHTFQITVTDSSGRSATSAVLNVVTNNSAPTVGWVTANGQTVARTIRLWALAQPDQNGSASVSKWCMTKDGARIATNSASGNPSYGYQDISYSGTFDPLTGCWSAYALDNLGSGEFIFNTTAWTNGTHRIGLTVTDSNNRTASTTLTFTTANPLATATVNGIPAGSIARATVAVSAGAGFVSAQSDLNVKTFCLRIDQNACLAATSTTLRSARWAVNTATFRNGYHQLNLSFIDTAGRKVTKAPIGFTISNPMPKWLGTSVRFVSPSVSDSTTTATASIRTIGATQFVLRYGTSKSSLTYSRTINVRSAADVTTAVSLSGIRMASTYYFIVTAKSANGTATGTITGSVSPPWPKILGTTCFYYINYDPYPYYYLTHRYRYLWSSNEYTWSPYYWGGC